MNQQLSQQDLDLIFREARTFSAWLPQPVAPLLLRQVYDLAKVPPTSANSQPSRFVFLTTPESKARLLPLVAPANVEKTRTAPVNVIVAWDTEFYEKLPKLFPHTDAAGWFRGNVALIAETAMRNSSLGGAYFIMAARALGLDCGPMSGFDAEKVDAEFFPDGKWRVNGSGAKSGLTLA
ncbi:MAG: malonic semialdehyde reductase [Acidobacteria bacterium]|nr:malonic semialdehyde reductase [Acidobacteriota bacterium]